MTRPIGSIQFTKVRAHCTWKDVTLARTTREHKLGNDFADYLARQGAAKHSFDVDLHRRVINGKVLTKSVHSMMVEIITARQAHGKLDLAKHNENSQDHDNTEDVWSVASSSESNFADLLDDQD
eukprot:12147579-Karenia_brevis.AAC.1